MEHSWQTNRVLRIFCDYGAPWPLWEEGLQTPQDYGLPEQLSSRLAAWNDDSQTHMHWDRGWLPGVDEKVWSLTGKQLAREVQLEVGDAILVHYGL